VPKLVAHTHRGQLVSAFGGAALCGYTCDDVLTATLPLFHVAGTIVAGLSAFMAATELVVMSPGGLRNPAIVEGFWRLIAQHKATVVGGVPTAMGAVLQVPVDIHNLTQAHRFESPRVFFNNLNLTAFGSRRTALLFLGSSSPP